MKKRAVVFFSILGCYTIFTVITLVMACYNMPLCSVFSYICYNFPLLLVAFFGYCYIKDSKWGKIRKIVFTILFVAYLLFSVGRLIPARYHMYYAYILIYALVVVSLMLAGFAAYCHIKDRKISNAKK